MRWTGRTRRQGPDERRAAPRRPRPPIAAPSRAATRRPANNFDGLRLVAALLVAYGHQTVDTTGTVGLRLLMFFAIGGFLVAGSWSSDPHLPRFWARRLLRLWPAYTALVVVCAAASWLFPARDLPDVSRMASLFYLSNVWSPGFDWGFFPFGDAGRVPFMNQSLWMLPYEVDLYAGFAVVACCGARARIVVAATLVVLALAFGTTPPTAAAGGLLECWSLAFAGFFAFGVLLRELPPLRGDAFTAACVAGGGVALACGARSAGLLLVIPPAAVWIGGRSWPVLRSAARFGDLSYGVFLWSFPVQQVTRLWLAPSTPLPLQLAVVLAQLLPIAWLSCRFVEVPALRWKPRRRVPEAPVADASDQAVAPAT